MHLVQLLVGACLFVGGIAFYKHRQFIKFKAAAEAAGVLAAVKAKL